VNWLHAGIYTDSKHTTYSQHFKHDWGYQLPMICENLNVVNLVIASGPATYT